MITGTYTVRIDYSMQSRHSLQGCNEVWEQGSVEWDQGSKGWDLGPQPGIKSHGICINSFLKDHRSGYRLYNFVGLGAEICHAFGIKGQKFGYKKHGISDEKTYLVLILYF